MNDPRRLVGAVLLSFSVSACASASFAPTSVSDSASGRSPTAGAVAPISSVLGIEKYFPLQRTYTWTYLVTSVGTSTRTGQEVTRIDAVSEASGTKAATYTTTRHEEGMLVAQGSGTMTLSSYQLTIAGDGGSEIISLPLQSGKEWASGTLMARSYLIERLVVQGKTYKDVMAIAYTKDGETKAVRWFAPNVGIVKQVARLTSNGEVVTVTSELTSAKVSAVTAVSLAPLSLTLNRNATASVSAQVSYDDGSVGRELTLSMADPGVATVTAAGLVTAGSATGSTVLTARSDQDSTKVATLSVVVN